MLLGLALGGVRLAHAADGDDAALVARVEGLLAQGVEPGAARATITELGPSGERALELVFENEGAARYVRLRALGLLASIANEGSARYLSALVVAAGSPSAQLGELHPARSSLVLRRALEGLSASAALLRPPLAQLNVAAVTRCLSHADAHVRRAAAQLLAKLDQDDTGQIDQALSMQLSHERSRMVRASMEQALTSRSARWQGPR